MSTLTTQTGAFTSANCAALGGLLTQTVLVETHIQQAGTDLAAHPGSFSALECDQIEDAISALLPAHALGLYLTSSKVYPSLQIIIFGNCEHGLTSWLQKADFITCGLATAGIKTQMTNMRTKTATIFTNLGPKVSGSCAVSITTSNNTLLSYWDLAIAGY